LLQALIDQHLTNQQMAEPAVSSGNPLYETYIQLDTELRSVAQELWNDSQASKVSLGHATVADMIAIDMTLPLKHRVKQQEQRLEDLKDLEKLAGQIQGSLAGSASLCPLGGSAASRRQCSWRSAGDLRTGADRRI
jgi:hypothetical protein